MPGKTSANGSTIPLGPSKSSGTTTKVPSGTDSGKLLIKDKPTADNSVKINTKVVSNPTPQPVVDKQSKDYVKVPTIKKKV